MKSGKVYLIPNVLHEEALETIPPYVLHAVKDCQVFFVENDRTARRFLKKLWKEMVIDDYEWHIIHKSEPAVKKIFLRLLKEGKNAGIISEAGCPGIADPGQVLVEAAQQQQITVQPLTGPSSVLMALMASGMSGQYFQFHGYLPIDGTERKKKLKELETDSHHRNCTQLFIETPYRNNAMLADLLQTCRDETRLCIAADITAPSEFIQTKSIGHWKKGIPELHKRPVIFLLYAGSL